MKLTFATRSSALARWQMTHVIQLLWAAYPGLEVEEYVIPAAGHRDPDTSLPEISGKRAFTRELEEVLLAGQADVVVHSLKDLPIEDTPGIVVAAIPKRAAAFDVLVSPYAVTLSRLPEGARVGTSSSRRTAQLLARRPDLTLMPLHGSIDTRVQKVLAGEYDAIVLSQAGLTHLGLQESIREVLPLDVMLPAPGQGALAVQCRAEDSEARRILMSIHDSDTAAAVHAERAFLSGLGGGCSLPVAAFAEKNNGNIILTGAVLSFDGKQSIRLSAVDQDPEKLGNWLAKFVLERGAAELMKASV